MIPANLAQNSAQLPFGDHGGLPGHRVDAEQVLLDRRCEIQKIHNLGYPRPGYMPQPRQFGVIFHHARLQQSFQSVRQSQ